MKTHISLNKVFWSFLIITFLAGSLALAAPVGKISAIQGRVDVLKTGKNVATPVSLGDPVDIGDIYRAKTRSMAEITFVNNNILKVGQASRVEIKEYMVQGERSSGVIRLHRGRVQAVAGEEFIKRAAAFAEGNKFEVHTPNAVAGIRGSNMLVSHISGATMVVFVTGRGYLYNPQIPRIVAAITAGFLSVVQSTETPPTPPKKATENQINNIIQQITPTGTGDTGAGTGAGTGTGTGAGTGTGTGDGQTPPPPAPKVVVVVVPDPPPPPPPPPPVPPAPQEGINLTGTLGGMPFEGGGTLSNTTLTANIPVSGKGTISASGTVTGNTGTTHPGTATGTSDKGGAFLGYTPGVQGSWLNRLSFLYLEGGNLYFLTGDAPGTFDGTIFSFSGSLSKSGSVGTITPTPETGQTLLDWFNTTTPGFPPPELFPTATLFTVSDSGMAITPSGRTALGGYRLTNEGRKVAFTSEIYKGTFGTTETASLPYLGYAGNNQYGVGPLSYTNDAANGKFTMDANLDFIGYDPQIGPYLGWYSMRYLGAYCSVSEWFRMSGAGNGVSTPANFFGDWGGGTLYLNNDGMMSLAGTDQGYFGGLTAPWTNPASFTAIGTYELYSGPSIPSHYLMNTSISASANPSVSFPAGTMEGYVGAIWKGGDASTVGTISDGTLRAVYVSTPDGSGYVTAGVMKSDVSGSYYPFSTGSTMWRTGGTLTPTPYLTVFDPHDLNYDSGSVWGRLSGDFNGTGSIIGGAGGDTKFLYVPSQSLPFGIFNIKFGYETYNYYEYKPTGNPSWSAKLGGLGLFDNDSGGIGYWLMTTSGMWTDTGEVTGSVTGKVMTPLRLYDVEGKFSGVNMGEGDSGTWIGQVIGSYYNGTALKFFSEFYSDMLDAVNNDGYIEFEYLSSMDGYLGGTTSLWSGSNIPITIMGSVGPSCLWYTSSPIYSYNVSTGLKTTYDGGAYYGIAGGNEYAFKAIQSTKTLEGKFIALYIDNSSTPKAGVLQAYVSGDIYKDIGMFKMDGLANRTEKSSNIGISASALYSNISQGSLDGVGAYLSGKFNNGAAITGGEDSGYPGATYAIATQPWGIYGLPMLGEFGELSTVPTSWSAKTGSYGTFGKTSTGDPDSGYWLATITGTVPTGATTSEGKLFGTLTGNYLTHTRWGSMDGDVYGTYEYTGLWKAVALGAWTGTDLSFSGDVSGGLLYYNTNYSRLVYANSDPLSEAHNVTGILGGIGNLWSTGSAQLYMMGAYSDLAPSPYAGKPRLAYGSGWYLDYNPAIWTGASTIGGAFKGYNVGLWKDGIINTEALVIYIDPSLKAGYAGGNLTGKYYSYPDMWELSGTLTRTFVETTDIQPADLSASLDQSNFTGHVAGRFTPSGGTIPSSYMEGSSVGLTGHAWGIWNAGMGGTYTTPATSTQALDFGGQYYYDLSWGYFLGHATAATTSSDTFSGTLNNSKVLTLHFLATMTGNIYGTIDSALQTWQAAGVGKWQATPLTTSLTFSTTDSSPTSLWRALPGTYYEADFTQYDGEAQSYYNYEYRYIQTSGKGFGKVDDDMGPYPDKLYFPNGTMWKRDQYGMISMTGWDIASIDEVRNLPPWMHTDDPSFTPTWYSEWPGFLDVLERRGSDYLYAILGMTGYPWSTGGTPVTVIGRFSPSDYTKPTIVITPFLFGTFYTPHVYGGTANGAYGLTVGGFIADDARGVQMAMRGLYVGPDNQTAGVLRHSQLLKGSLYKDIGMWDAEGTLVATVMNSNFASNTEGVNIGNFSENIIGGPFASQIMGRFTGDSGSLFGTMENSGTARFIKGQDWGIFSSTIWVGGFGVSSTTIPDTWSTQIGAQGQFGAYKDASNNWQADLGMMLIPTLSGTFTGGVVKASNTGTVGQFMTMTKMGTISDVGVLGVYTQPSTVIPNTLYSWQGNSGGVWNTTQYFTFASYFDASNRRFAEMHSGGYSDGSYNHYHYYYDNEVKYGDISFFSDASRTLITQRKYETDVGPFPTPTWYEYTYAKGTNTFSGYTTGTDYPSSFSDAFFSALAAAKGEPAPNYISTWYNFSDSGSISAIMGGVGDLWTATASNPATVYFLGDYDNWNGRPTIFGTNIESYNIKNDTNTTLDGKGAYYGYIGGREIDGTIEGRIYAIYLDPAETSPAGILKGAFTGTVYSGIEMWAGQGTIYPVKLMDVSVPLGDFSSHLYTRDFYDDNGINSSFTLNGYAMGGTDRPYVWQGEGTTFYAAEGSWGVWQSAIGGRYYGITPTDSWTAMLEFIDTTRIMGNAATGTKWSGNKIEGTTVGYGADIQPAQTYTWISVGEAKGTFNPTLLAFQIGVMGVSIETNTFLALASNTVGRTQLQKLNVPCVEVGNVTLTGSGNNFSTLSMNNVKFFAETAGGKPTVWATGSVTGTYTAPPVVGSAIGISGGPLSGSFTFKAWNPDNSGKWLSSVSGTGGFNGSTSFKGAAAGTGATSGSGTISGTAAGVAK